MPIITLQKEAGQIGRIRLGHSISGVSQRTQKEYRRPAKLEAFRFTTHSEHAARAVADLLGGEAQPWTDGAPSAGQWQVFTDRAEVNVIVPPSAKAVDSWYEMWLPAMCVRRCDGATEQKSGQPCLCPSDLEQRASEAAKGRACRMTTRVNVMIPDLPGIGVWMLESHGFYAATEMTAVAEMLAVAGQNGVRIPARLRIEQRERRIFKGDGVEAETRKFPVPVLEVLATLREITSAAESGQRALASSMPPAIEPVRAAISAGPVAGPAAPTSDAAALAQGLADRALCVKDDRELRAVWEEAASVLDEWVTVPHYQELISLGDVIKERKQDFDRRGNQ